MLDKLLRAIYPLEQQYYLRIWYNTPVNSQIILSGRPWRFVPFASLLKRHLRREGAMINPDQESRIECAHIYLFLTSYQSLGTQWIEDREMIPAIRRYIRYGDRFVRIFPILLAPSLHKQKSRLSSFQILGPAATIAKYPLENEAWLLVCQQLEPHIRELQQNLAEATAIMAANADTRSALDVQPADNDAQFMTEETYSDFGPPRIDLTRPVVVPQVFAWLILFGLTFAGYWLLAPQMFVRAYRLSRETIVKQAEAERQKQFYEREFPPAQITPTLPPPAPDTFPWPDRRGGPRIVIPSVDSSGLEFDN